jgi:hypothetical protein
MTPVGPYLKFWSHGWSHHSQPLPKKTSTHAASKALLQSTYRLGITCRDRGGLIIQRLLALPDGKRVGH